MKEKKEKENGKERNKNETVLSVFDRSIGVIGVKP
jgi:hypothetical protein